MGSRTAGCLDGVTDQTFANTVCSCGLCGGVFFFVLLQIANTFQKVQGLKRS